MMCFDAVSIVSSGVVIGPPLRSRVAGKRARKAVVERPIRGYEALWPPTIPKLPPESRSLRTPASERLRRLTPKLDATD
jgi:hypothetical protein